MIEISPVLTFNGNCEDAFDYYRSVFGGDFQFLYRYKDVESDNIPVNKKEKIMHVSLPLMKNINLMGSDTLGNINPGESLVSIGLRMNDKDETFRLFEALSNKGRVETPLAKVFYADYFGTVVDRFGVRWSFNCNIGRESAI